MNTKLLRQKILDLAIRGKLVPQDPNDEPASVLLEKIRAEKERLIKEKKIKSDKSKNTADRSNYKHEQPFEIPESWEWETIKDISNSIQYGYTGKALSQGKYKMLRITDIQNNCVNWDSVPYVKIDEDKAEDYLLYDGDILFARTGATVGKSFLIVDLNEKSVFASYLIRIKPNKNINTKYIKFFLESNFYWEQISKNSVGTGQPNVNGTILGELRISIPPLSEQNRIVAEIERLFKFINTIEENKFSIEEYFSLMKSKVLDLAIRGKLIAQDPNDEPASVLLERIGKGKKVTSDKTNYPFEVPSSWTWIELNNVLEYEQPTKYRVKSTEYSNDFSIPVLTAGKSFIIGYTDEKDGVFTDLPVIIFDDFTTSSQYVDFEFKVKSSAMKILRAKKEIADTKYIAFFMSITRLTGNTHKRYWISEYSKIKIPLPPLAEQKRIVSQIETIFAQLDIIADSLKE